MMLKMHVADNDGIGKIGLALFARGERHGNQARVFVRHCPGRHRPNRNNKRNCEDKSDEQLAQFTPSMNRSIISMLPATAHVSIHNNSLFWSKDFSWLCRLRAEPMPAIGQTRCPVSAVSVVLNGPDMEVIHLGHVGQRREIGKHFPDPSGTLSSAKLRLSMSRTG